MPNGVYFCTIKQQDGENNKTSNFDQASVFRVAIGLHLKTYDRWDVSGSEVAKALNVPYQRKCGAALTRRLSLVRSLGFAQTQVS